MNGQHNFSCNQTQLADRPPPINTDFYCNTLIANAIGTSVNSAFPLVRRMASYRFDIEVALLGMTLSSSVKNTDVALAGVFAVANQTEILDISGSSGLYMSHITWLNSAAITAPTSRSNGIGFGDDSGIRLNSGISISLYMCAANVAAILMAATLTLMWRPLGSK